MRKNDIVVDSRFFIPNNIVDIRFKQEDTVGRFWGGGSTPPPSGEIIEEGSTPNSDASLPTPNIEFNIVSQTIKTAPDGMQTVDVVIELPDVTGAEYDVRITRVA